METEINLSFIQTEIHKLGDWLAEKAVSLLLALVFLFVGMQLAKLLMKWIEKGFQKSKVDPTVRSFLLSIVRILLYVLVFITTASILGIQVTSFVTLLGTAGITVGLALQGSLSNFAGGVLILLLKPFVIGDYIREDTHNNEGTVISIDIFYTRLHTFDGKMVVIPNGVLSNASLTNYTKQAKRRIDLHVPISYGAELTMVQETVREIIRDEAKILKEEPIDVVLDGFLDSSLDLVVHVWVKTEDYWETKWSLLQSIKTRFDSCGIEIPFNQLDVHMKAE